MALGTMGAVRLPVDQQPTPGPLRYGLFNVAPPRTIYAPDGDPNLPDHAFGGGLYYYPQGCGIARPYPVVCDNPPPTKTFDPDTAEVLVLPFVVYSTIICGPRGNTTAYLTSKTGSRLFSGEQSAVEFALMTGGGAGVGAAPRIDDPAGPYGAPTDVGGGLTFANITDAVSALEDFAYNNLAYGYNAVLHAQSAMAAYAQDANLVHSAAVFGGVWGVPGVTVPDDTPEITLTDPVIRTALGTKWVFGGGYPGTGVNGAAPAAGKTYMWITGNVSTWRAPTWSPPDPMQVFDRGLNQIKVLAERPYMATFDCFHAYALVDQPNPAV